MGFFYSTKTILQSIEDIREDVRIVVYGRETYSASCIHYGVKCDLLLSVNFQSWLTWLLPSQLRPPHTQT